MQNARMSKYHSWIFLVWIAHMNTGLHTLDIPHHILHAVGNTVQCMHNFFLCLHMLHFYAKEEPRKPLKHFLSVAEDSSQRVSLTLQPVTAETHAHGHAGAHTQSIKPNLGIVYLVVTRSRCAFPRSYIFTCVLLCFLTELQWSGLISVSVCLCPSLLRFFPLLWLLFSFSWLTQIFLVRLCVCVSPAEALLPRGRAPPSGLSCPGAWAGAWFNSRPLQQQTELWRRVPWLLHKGWGRPEKREGKE